MPHVHCLIFQLARIRLVICVLSLLHWRNILVVPLGVDHSCHPCFWCVWHSQVCIWRRYIDRTIYIFQLLLNQTVVCAFSCLSACRILGSLTTLTDSTTRTLVAQVDLHLTSWFSSIVRPKPFSASVWLQFLLLWLRFLSLHLLKFRYFVPTTAPINWSLATTVAILFCEISMVAVLVKTEIVSVRLIRAQTTAALTAIFTISYLVNTTFPCLHVNKIGS